MKLWALSVPSFTPTMTQCQCALCLSDNGVLVTHYLHPNVKDFWTTNHQMLVSLKRFTDTGFAGTINVAIVSIAVAFYTPGNARELPRSFLFKN